MSNFLTALVIGIAVPVALRWLYSVSSRGSVQRDASDLVYAPSRTIAILRWTAIIMSIGLLGGALATSDNPGGRIVLTVVGMAFFAMGMLCRSIPIVLSQEGIRGESMFGRKAFIPWSQVKEISYRTGNRLTTVVGADGVKIYHAGFHADPEGFRREIKARTHLPLKIIEPGVIKPRITLD